MRAGTTGIIFLFGEQCFIEVARVPLLYRVLLSGQKVGIQKWVILAWYEAPRVYARLAVETKLKDICWRVYDMQDADSTSLTEVLPDEETLVIPCTAVFDHRVLLALQESKQASLCVRTTKSAMHAGTTEGLLVQNGQVIAEAPTTHTTYLTTGILRCPGKLLRRAMFETWEVMQSASDPLKSVLSGLMAGTTLKALDVDQYLWVPLTPPFKTSVATAEIQLLRSLGREGDSPIVRMIDRRISQALTKRLMYTTITPNQITLASATLGLCGAFLLAQPSHLWQLFGSLLFLLSTITDGCDGEIARLTFQESAFGAKLDVTMDNVVHFFLFPAIALGLYRYQHDPLYLVLGALALGGVLLSMVVFLPYVLRQSYVDSARTRLHKSLASRDFAYFLPILALLDKLHWFLWATVVGTYLFAAAWVIIAWRERQRQPGHPDKEPSSG